MTSEERAINWISCNIDNKDEVYREGILYTLKRLLDHHAAEARAEQREVIQCLTDSNKLLEDMRRIYNVTADIQHAHRKMVCEKAREAYKMEKSDE